MSVGGSFDLLDAAVLQFQNQKLLQKLETQKVEINALEDRLCLLRDKQYSYEKTLAVADNSWKELVDHLESDSNCSLENTKDVRGFGRHQAKEGSFETRSMSSSDDLLKQVKTHEVALAELSSLSSSDPRAVYERHGNIFFQTTVQKATASEQKQLAAAKTKLQKPS